MFFVISARVQGCNLQRAQMTGVILHCDCIHLKCCCCCCWCWCLSRTLWSAVEHAGVDIGRLGSCVGGGGCFFLLFAVRLAWQAGKWSGFVRFWPRGGVNVVFNSVIVFNDRKPIKFRNENIQRVADFSFIRIFLLINNFFSVRIQVENFRFFSFLITNTITKTN